MSAAPFAKRRAAFEKALFRDAHGEPFLAVVHSGRPGKLDRFVPDSSFYYFTGIEAPDSCYVVLSDGRKISGALFLPPPNPAKARWEGGELSSGYLDAFCRPDDTRKATMDETGFEAVFSRNEIFDFIERSLDLIRLLYLDFSSSPGCTCSFPYEFRDKLCGMRPSISARNLRETVVLMRNVKDPFEVGKIRAAIAIAAEAQEAVMDHLAPGMFEYEMEALVNYIFKNRGGQGEAFATIVGSGKNSTVLHYNRNGKRMEKGEVVVCDLGVRKDYYCSDLTRTFPVSGKFSKEHLKLYSIVMEAQALAFSRARAGVSIAEVNGAVGEFYKKKGVSAFNYHGVSHHLGLDTHDGGTLDAKLRENAVITVEPGLYDQKSGIGVRIEDDVLVGRKGCEVLSKALIKDPGDIEKRMSRPRKKIVV